jgi:hypothetical protein
MILDRFWRLSLQIFAAVGALASFTSPMQTAQSMDLHRYNNYSCYYALSQRETIARWLNHLVQTRGARAQHRVKCSVEL